jgi:hypothetical protein
MSSDAPPDWVSNWLKAASAHARAGSLAAVRSGLEGLSARATAGSVATARTGLEGASARATAGSIGSLVEPILPLEPPSVADEIRVLIQNISENFARLIA